MRERPRNKSTPVHLRAVPLHSYLGAYFKRAVNLYFRNSNTAILVLKIQNSLLSSLLSFPLSTSSVTQSGCQTAWWSSPCLPAYQTLTLLYLPRDTSDNCGSCQRCSGRHPWYWGQTQLLVGTMGIRELTQLRVDAINHWLRDR